MPKLQWASSDFDIEQAESLVSSDNINDKAGKFSQKACGLYSMMNDNENVWPIYIWFSRCDIWFQRCFRRRIPVDTACGSKMNISRTKLGVFASVFTYDMLF